MFYNFREDIYFLIYFSLIYKYFSYTDEFVKESNNNNIAVRKLDLSSLQSIREFAQQINEEESRLDLLIHNAGTAETFRKNVTEDGLEMTMATNYFGPFLLTHLLIGKKL